MSNLPNAQPASFDTDIASYRAAQTLQTPGTGVRVNKIRLVAAGTTSVGSVSITDPRDNTVLYPPIPVSAGVTAGTIIWSDFVDNQTLTWRDFKIVGLTASDTRLFLWFRP